MSINSSLVKLADKIDVDGKSTISPEYKNPNNSIEKSIERIADNYSGSGGGGGGVLVVSMSIVDGSFILDKTYGEIKNANYALLKGNFVEGITMQGFIVSIEDIESGGDVCISLPNEDADVYTLAKTVLHADTGNDYPSGDVPD